MHIAQQIAQAVPRYNVSADPADQTPAMDADLLSATVDRLAEVKAMIAALKVTEEELKADLIATGCKCIKGAQHQAAITYATTKTCIDWKSIAQHYKPSRQLITAHTTESEPFDTVRMSAKSTS
jgi:hypothetical protein